MLQKGFTLIELMIVVAIIGILAMFAIPAYQDYTRRTYVAEGMSLAAGAKSAVTEYYASKGKWPTNNVEAGVASASRISGSAVNKVEIADQGVIVITYNEKVAGPAGTQKLGLQGYASDGSFVWKCGPAAQTPPAGNPDPSAAVVPTTDTTVPVKLLPANCR